ncbi:MAG: M1 family metallopeptidase [Cryomorphaceae bacterium]|nr:M1 family metallopeptidase [Cryomorphaceae bacterium]
MKYLAIFKLLIFSGILIAQPRPGYWQQHVNYEMHIDFDHERHQFEGNQIINYTNNSPDTLHELFYHLQFNAFQPGSNMDERSRSIADPDRRVGDRINHLTKDEIGFLEVVQLKYNGEVIDFETWGTILKVTLSQPILPGKSCVLAMDFIGQIPAQIRRSGRFNKEGVHYSMAQWYPKLAEYDRYGWNTTPYVGREFYGIWGDFDVYISIDKSYTLAGTGILQNAAEIGHGYGSDHKAKGNGKQTWHFRAENVHDFVWAADPKYSHTTHAVPGGPLMRFFYKEKKNEHIDNWEKLPKLMERFFILADSLVGPYPYPEFSFIQGGDGGMEYPMATLMLGRGKLKGMVGLAVHEAMHSWFYGLIGTNESRYPWIDEGFTTFVENIIMQDLFPEEGPRATNPHFGNYMRYVQQFKKGATEPLTTPADHYTTNSAYSVASYSQGCLFLVQLKYIMGEETFWKGFRSFFNKWKFHHPHPEDFIREMEKASGMQLMWFCDLWTGTTQAVDLAVDSVYEKNNETIIVLRRLGDLPSPATIAIVNQDGKADLYHIPLDLMYGRKSEAGNSLPPWKWAAEKYTISIPTTKIKEIYIDPFFQSVDIERKNNVWPIKVE